MILKRGKEWLKIYTIVQKNYIKQEPKLQGIIITDSFANERKQNRTVKLRCDTCEPKANELTETTILLSQNTTI